MPAINLLDKFSRFSDQWSPKVIAELNGQAVKLAKVQGTFVWHDHAEEDELFFVVRGTLLIDFEDRETVRLEPGELYVVPRGVRHCPRTEGEEEVWLMLLEPISTKHTGEVEDARTVRTYDRL
ncbi:mannose-6-phosphate isomerase-like protein (cupin superfamily) [Lewinella marina]|uniref:Mannose-6-phosphate isomerase n=1 Tax=Neolewinella marina TaxID=438751 RepID=A0A2G0CII2_9BACT|nr:cupin domain-containing protein [Neolewinella marina]NJB85068.1 mannose-6-phosphate isomerase-like protein (cupin superfamily) [Neolewinella marina]PHK99791.1 mannose-6-phosphate isomerase [Neolewinella marina]